jgi:hypothetical protein
MTTAEIAAVYLVLGFLSQARPIVVLPMANLAVCQQENTSIEAAYLKDSGGIKLFAHCVQSRRK